MLTNKPYVWFILVLLLQSCSSKKEILYFQDAKFHKVEKVVYESSKIQPNDILSIIVTTPIPEAAIPYNIQSLGSQGGGVSVELLKLQGYLVSENNSIDFPILGEIKTEDKTIEELESDIQQMLTKGGHLKGASVNIRLLNAKVTILGEVRQPGTFTFTENTITLPQALGYSGDLLITGKRNDILVIREENGIRTMNKIDITSADWFSSPYYYIKPNDVILVNPNTTKIKSAGFVGNAGIVLTIASLILTSIVLITR